MTSRSDPSPLPRGVMLLPREPVVRPRRTTHPRGRAGRDVAGSAPPVPAEVVAEPPVEDAVEDAVVTVVTDPAPVVADAPPDAEGPLPDLVVVDDTPAERSDPAADASAEPPAEPLVAPPAEAPAAPPAEALAELPAEPLAATPAEALAGPPAVPPADADARHPWRARARAAAWVSAIVAVAVVLLVFVFPTRTYLNQQRQLSTATRQLRLLDQQNAQLSTQAARLQTDSELERLAREQYHLVRPGERAFAILPAPAQATPVTAPPPKPATGWTQRVTGWIP